MKRSALTTLILTCVSMTSGCGVGSEAFVGDPAGAVDDVEMSLEAESASDRGGIGAMALPDGEQEAAAVAIDPRKSLMVTDQAVLTGFTLKAVMDQLVAQSGVSGLTSLALFRQWWDTQRRAPGLGLGAHCDDQKVNGVPSLNGFPHECPRPEGVQATTDPFVNPAAPGAYFPIAVVNRFDLAPVTGAHCGEYRVIFARRSGLVTGDRNFAIFEAVLANPRLDLGLEGCRPVLNFWSSLSTKTAAVRAALLRSFHFTGLPGFSPVVHIDNYGNTRSRPTGQVRTNQFMGGARRHVSAPPQGGVRGHHQPRDTRGCVRNQVVPAVVKRQQVFAVSVTFRNLGNAAWTEQNQFRLASEGPADNLRWGSNRVRLGPSEKIHVGQTKTFRFTVTAPAIAGGYVFQWRMIDDPGVRFGALSTPVSITVL